MFPYPLISSGNSPTAYTDIYLTLSLRPIAKVAILVTSIVNVQVETRCRLLVARCFTAEISVKRGSELLGRDYS